MPSTRCQLTVPRCLGLQWFGGDLAIGGGSVDGIHGNGGASAGISGPTTGPTTGPTSPSTTTDVIIPHDERPYTVGTCLYI